MDLQLEPQQWVLNKKEEPVAAKKKAAAKKAAPKKKAAASKPAAKEDNWWEGSNLENPFARKSFVEVYGEKRARAFAKKQREA